MNFFFDSKTTVGKTESTLLWVAFSAAITAVLSFILHNKDLFNPVTVAAANVLMVFLKNLFDKTVPNL